MLAMQMGDELLRDSGGSPNGELPVVEECNATSPLQTLSNAPQSDELIRYLEDLRDLPPEVVDAEPSATDASAVRCQ